MSVDARFFAHHPHQPGPYGIRVNGWLLLLAVVLIISLLTGSLPVQADSSASIPTALASLIEEQPNQPLRLLVQADIDGTKMADEVASLNGRLIHTLTMLNAYALELPAHSVPGLSQLQGVRWISLDAPVQSSSKDGGDSMAVNTYLDTLSVHDIWAQGIRGNGVTVAVIDSGIAQGPDFDNLQHLSFNKALNNTDSSGHGTHVAGIIAGDGQNSNGLYAGIAPDAGLIALNISDGSGMAYESDTVAAMQWVLNNKATYNIRVVNLSINSTAQDSFHASALNAAAEILWFNGIVVVASAGNASSDYNTTIRSAPANDPFIITVGALREEGTANHDDDSVAEFSATGITLDGFNKPDIVAPGTQIISVLASNSDWSKTHANNRVDGSYFRASGTSMSAPMVSGAVALLLQAEPYLTPDQVKYRLLSTTYSVPDYRFGNSNTAPRVPALDVFAALTTPTAAVANTGLFASQLLWSGNDQKAWSRMDWDSVNWHSVNWDNVNWNSVNWGSVNWSSVTENDGSWNAIHWNDIMGKCVIVARVCYRP